MTEPVSGRQPVLALLMRLIWAAALALPVFGSEAAVVFTSLYSFPNGASPVAGLVQGSDGSFYGTTYRGLVGNNPVAGFHDSGTVFKITTNGALTTLHLFTGGNDGARPAAGLVQGSDGSFYGTTYGGGTNGVVWFGGGTVFKISPTGALASLYSFTGGNDGANPQAALVQGSDGYFYGTTSGGGTNGAGTVFKISTNGALTSLYSFTGRNDGEDPAAALVQGSDGYFYGTTQFGGTNNSGTVFKISANGALTTLYSFTGSDDGQYPGAGLVQGSDGNFYGTTSSGGTNYDAFNGTYGYGTVFKISPNGALTSLYSFNGGNDGAYPQAGLVQGSDGSFYGTTQYSGATNYNGFSETYGYGTVFKISPNGALTSLCSFNGGNEGAYPQAGLVQGSDGSFYGTTGAGVVNGVWSGGWGTVFRISGDGVLTSLYSFGSTGGANPEAGLVQGSDGNFYGTTYGGGNLETAYEGSGSIGLVGLGTVFKISTSGVLTTLHSFTGVNDGALPRAALVEGTDGSFYGTTQVGGTNGGISIGGVYGPGTVFKISTNGALTTLYAFGSITNASGEALDGANPDAGLVQGRDGYFYGTTEYGGTNFGYGNVFKISPNGALTSLYSFTGGNDGAIPLAGLVQGRDGSFYGTTQYGGVTNYDALNGPYGYGSVFKISPDGTLTSLYSLTGNDGANPCSGLVLGRDGNFYGTTQYGGTTNHNAFSGTYGYGTVFKISPDGVLTNLYSFTGGNDGAYPSAGLVQGSDGNFYGTTQYGGTTNYNAFSETYGYGTMFKISPNGAYTSLYFFTGGNEGANPQAGLVQGSDGSFYGTTSAGGQGGAGTVFRLTVVPPPQLTIIPSGPYVILTWPTDYAGFSYVGFILQSTTTLVSSAVWTTVSPEPVVIGGQNVVINTISGAQTFYRLSSP